MNGWMLSFSFNLTLMDMTSQASDDARVLFIKRSKGRLYAALDYLTFFLYVTTIAIAAFAIDYLFASMIGYLLLPSISEHQLIKQAFDWFKIGSAFLMLIAAGVHTVFSAWSQIRFEAKSVSEE